jgi:Asp-tRNA(Asn)/Glu-tRNA(Gln) amidotransferase A subunit family amidase/ketopantoate reductase
VPGRVVVVGAGGAGGTLAALVAAAGRNVLLCETDEEHRVAVDRHGLMLSTRTAVRRVALSTVTPESLPEGLRTVIVAVRGDDLGAALELVVPRLHPGGLVVVVQDGVPLDDVAAMAGAERTVGAILGFSAHLVAPGRIVVEREGQIAVGTAAGGTAAGAAAVAALIPRAVPTSNLAALTCARRVHLSFLLAAEVAGLPPSEVLASERYTPLLCALAAEIAAQCPAPAAFDGVDPANPGRSIRRLAGEWAVADSLRPDGADCRCRPRVDPAAFRGVDGFLVGRLKRLAAAADSGSRSRAALNLDHLATIDRCRSAGERLNAVTQLLDLSDHDPVPGPLCGVPVALKDNIDVEGLPTTNGSGALRRRARSNARVVERLLAAGAEPVCKTNMLEFAIGNPSRKYGGTRNPWDPSRTSGGSSGGSAALVAAGAVDYAIGTDTSGSVLVPASYCGIVGVKPTHGLVPMAGVTPLAPTCDHVGTLTRTAEQAFRLLSVLTEVTLRLRDVDGLRIGLLRDHLQDDALTEPVRDVMTERTAALGLLPVDVREVAIPELALVDEALSAIVLHEADEWHHSLLTVPELAEGTRLFLEHAARCGRGRYRRGLAAQERVIAAFERTFEDVDVLVGPTVFRTAPAADALYTTPEDDLESRFTGAYSVTGNPAVTVPCAVDEDGLPIGLLLGGPRHSEDTLLSLAHVLQRQVLEPPRLETVSAGPNRTMEAE